MMKMYGMAGMDPSMFGSTETLVLHSAAFLRKSNHRRDVLIFQFFYFDLQFVFAKSFAEECSQSIGLILQLVGGNFFLEVIGHIRIDTLEMDIFLLFLTLVMSDES